jgi:serine/threonine protein kinase
VESQIGQVLLRRYLVDRLVGQGSLGWVYEARDFALNRRVAIRLIDTKYDNEQIAAFIEKEAKVAGEVVNRHLTELIDVGRLPSGERCIISEFVDGETLQSKMEKLGCMSELGVTQLLGQLLKGLGAAHKAGVYHRDLTPRSIFIAPGKAGRGDIVRIVDFGLSRLGITRADRESELAPNDADRNSFQYLSPEQLNGLSEPDARSNIYGLAVTAYEAVSGKLPFEGEDFGSLRSNILLEDPKPLETLVPRITPQLVKLIGKAMARSPNARFQSAEEMSAAVLECASRANAAYTRPQLGEPGVPEGGSVAPVSRRRTSVPPAKPTGGSTWDMAALESPESWDPPANEQPDSDRPEPELFALSSQQAIASEESVADPSEEPALLVPPPPAIETPDQEAAAPESRTRQSTEPGIQPEPAAIPIPEQSSSVDIQPAPEFQIQPAPQSQPEALVEPAPQAQPEARVEPAPQAQPEARVEPAPQAQPRTRVQPTSQASIQVRVPSASRGVPPVASAASDDLDDLGPYGSSARRSRTPMVLAIVLIALGGTGIVVAWATGRVETGKPEVPQVVPSAVVLSTPRVIPSAVVRVPTESADVRAATPTVPAAQLDLQAAIRAAQTARKSDSASPSKSPAMPSKSSAAPTKPAVAPAKKQGAPRRGSDKDPYDYR